MKKIILFLFIGLIVACSSDDSTPNDSGLVGVWLLISSVDEEGDEYIPLDEGDCPHETIISETNVKARTYFGENCESSAESAALSYTLNGDSMDFELGTESESLKIIELTTTTLKIKDGDDSFYQIATYSRQ